MNRSVGPYVLVEPLGEGALGKVYRAERDGRAYVVKIVAVADGDLGARLVEREAKVAARLVDHPGCARVIEVGRTDDSLYLVREYVPGRPLAHILGERRRLPVREAVDIAVAILEAAGAAHRAGVVHRDLKPENVLMADDGRVLVLDFGVAHLTQPAGGGTISLSAGGTVVGTPEYLAPEQALGETIDGRADVYAVGVMLYEMLAGRRPVEGANLGELISAHLLQSPASLRAAAPDVAIPAPVEAAVLRALAKRRDDRFADADAFAAALREAAAGRAETVKVAAVPVPKAPVAAATDPATAPLARAAPPEPPPLAPVAAAPPRRRGAVVAVVVGVAAAAAGVLALRRPDAAPPAVREDIAPAVGAIRAAVRKGDVAGARATAETLARRRPDDAAAFAVLGDVLFAQGDKERALAAYRAAVRMDRSVGASEEVLANLRATFADPVHGDAAFSLAEDIGPPARAIIRDVAVTTTSGKVKRRAADALAKIDGPHGPP